MDFRILEEETATDLHHFEKDVNWVGKGQDVPLRSERGENDMTGE